MRHYLAVTVGAYIRERDEALHPRFSFVETSNERQRKGTGRIIESEKTPGERKRDSQKAHYKWRAENRKSNKTKA